MAESARALVVDDSRATRLILAKMLTDLGFDVSEADDGDTGLDAIRSSGPFDVALIDWHMPRMNGIELIGQIRSEPPPYPVRLLMVTTESLPESVERALAAGADEFVMKPFTKEMIREKLHLVGLEV